MHCATGPSSPTPVPLRADLARPRQLVGAPWLMALCRGASVEAAPAGDWQVFEVDQGAPLAFCHSHVPGAGYIDTNLLEHPPLWQSIPPEHLQDLLRGWGLGTDSTVILYGRTTAAAARAAHLMMVAGIQDVRLLDGGFDAWLRAGGRTVGGPPAPVPARARPPGPLSAHPEYLVQTDGLRHAMTRPGTRIVSIRTWDEFSGRTSGYSYIPARGEIPGAVWGHAGDDDDMNSVSSFQHADGRMREAQGIAALWAAVGVLPAHDTIFYCGTGWRASVAFFYAWLMGWERIRVYDGGWLAWSSDPANPVELRSQRPASARLSVQA
jgi:molybdopterin synthase sulfurtransferase